MSENTPNVPEQNAPRGAVPPPPKAPAPAAPASAASKPKAEEPAKRPEAPAPAPLPNPLAHLSLPFQPVDFNLRGVHVDATVEPGQVVMAAEQLDREGFAIDTITGVDWLAQGQMEVVYDYFHPVKGLRAAVRSRVPRENPEIATISNVFPGANWHERETHDFFGIRFLGHPNLTPFLLPEDADYHPLKKDFKA